MNVCIAVPWDQEFGGVATVVGNLAKYLKSHGSEPYFAHPEGTDRLTRKTTRWGFEGFALRMRGPFDPDEPLRNAAAFLARFPGTIGQIRVFLRRHAVKVVNVHYPIDSFVYFAVLRKLGAVKLVVSIHGTDLFPKGRRSDRYSRSMLLLLRSADRIVAPSRGFLDEFLEVFPEHEAKATFIHNGIDLAALSPDGAARFAAAGSVAHPTGAVAHDASSPGPAAPAPSVPGLSAPGQGTPGSAGRYVLCIADYNVKKGLDVLLRAYSGLEERKAGLRLLLVGEGPLRADLEALVRELGLEGQALVMGRRPRPEIAALLHGCELLVLPSRSEPFGIAVIEAMACRRPVVATAVGGIREIVTSGEDGLLVPPDDAEALARGIGEILRDDGLGRRLGARGQETVARRFTYETTGSAYAKLFSELTNHG